MNEFSGLRQRENPATAAARGSAQQLKVVGYRSQKANSTAL